MGKIMTASDAKNRFGQMLDDVQAEPVRIQKNGRDVAVVLSADEFKRLAAQTTQDAVNDRVKQLHTRSAERWSKVYRALAQ